MSFGKPKDEKELPKDPTALSGVVNNSAATAVGGVGAAVKADAFLGKGSKVVGTLTFTGPAEIDGNIEGEIVAQDRLTIGESAVVNARITGSEILIKGTVTGDVSASKRLSLRRPARITGNISSTNLSIEEGVIFEGKCVMSPNGIRSVDSKAAVVKPLGTEKVASA